MATPKVIHYDITIHVPYLEKQLEALIYLGEKVMNIATAAQRLVEAGFLAWQQYNHYKIENLKIAFKANSDALAARDLALYEKLKAEGKLFDIYL
jgi:hypothetical protein